MPTTYDVFVSYAREDLKRVQPWVQELKDGGVSAFFDMESLLGGGKWQGEIAEAIHSAKLVILFVSRSSVASEFVPKELALAVEMKKHILPVFLEETEVRGQLAFSIAGLQRVQAHGPQVNVRQILRTIQPKLREFGVEWVNPTQFLNGVRQAPRRDADEIAGKDNVRRTKEEEPAAAPVHESDEDEVPHGTSWTTIWLAFMMLAGAVIAFYWLGGAEWWAGGKPVQPPVGAKPVPQPDPSIPPALPVRLEDEAPDLAEQYYLAANQNPAGQIALLADTVDYLGHPGWKHSDVKADLEAYAKRWTRQHFEVLAKPPQVRVIEPDKVVECDVSLRYTSENAIVTSTVTFTGRLRMQRFGNDLQITSVAEVPGTRKSEPLKFNPEAQKKAVIDFITRSVVSGSSTSGMKPEDIAAMYVEKPDYFGRIATHEDIIKETQTLISRWELRDYRVLEGPDIISGLGTPEVEVKVGLDYRVSSPSRGGKTSQGWVRSVYLVHFSADGTPLIQKHAEVDRGQ
jgi:hypothetical protein